jgi:beta-lactamase superfamily II metal-dependent hydrolase
LVSDGAALTSTVLKAPGHGECKSITGEFLDAVGPEVMVIGAEEESRCDEMLKGREGLSVYRSDQHGTVEVISDGHRLWVETER